ncbi:MAG: UDP-N-acetyl-D-mannosamine dehydrogenase [Planctomycetes bacterium]|nr:UDP-N-acetyl-D-mannosamine dehydrogenase [Planctomycetota bacterium]
MSRNTADRLTVFSDREEPRSPPREQTVSVVGLGYIGLPTAAILADRGYRVHGVDVRPDVVATINGGGIHIHEPHLDALVAKVVRSGRLTASTRPGEADVHFLCVPTPINADTSADLSYVEAAARSIRPHVRRGNLIILESTSPPGTTERIVAPHAVPPEFEVGRDVFVSHCPERVLPGRILIEAVENDRIVGGMTTRCAEKTRRFYEMFVTGGIFTTSATAAETAKLVENSFRDVNIAFANELSMMCDQLGIDVHEIIELANRHPRVNILSPGPGVGGHCISVDPWFLVHACPEQTPLIRQARGVNNHKPHVVLRRIVDAARARGARTIGCLGLAYKADVDDLRESPSLEIVRELRAMDEFELLVCEPYVVANRFTEFPLTDLDDVLRRSDVLALLTDHAPFRNLPFETLQGKSVVDPRGTWRRTLREGGAAKSLPRAA